MQKLIPALITILLLAGCVPEDTTTPDTTEKTDPTATTQTEEEQTFNESGQAKAIENETDLWQQYSDEETAISFRYPQEVQLLGEYPEDETQTYIKIEVKDIGATEHQMDLSKEEAMQNIEALSAGEFGVDYDWPFEPSKQVKSVGFLFAQDFMVLSRFDVCDITLERKLLFYYNNKQIIITLFGPVETLKQTMPEYFTQDPDNCGEDLMWDAAKQNQLYGDLVAEGAPEPIQTWFNTFDQIAETIVFPHR